MPSAKNVGAQNFASTTDARPSSSIMGESRRRASAAPLGAAPLSCRAQARIASSSLEDDDTGRRATVRLLAAGPKAPPRRPRRRRASSPSAAP